MYITDPMPLPAGNACQHTYENPPLAGRFQLVHSDRVGIERLLSLGLIGKCANPTLIAGFLRHKLRLARHAPEPIPATLVVAGRWVSFMTTGRKARWGKLTMVQCDDANCIPVTSFLGATMLGMTKLQKAPLLREDGGIDTLVVLEVGKV